MNETEFAGKRVVVMGLGHFGGGIAVCRWLAKQGAQVTVTDSASCEKLSPAVAELRDLPLTFHLGGHDVGDLERCDLLVVSPAVPKETSAFVAEAVRRGIPISSEMNLFVERCPARRMVGITGSAGKSTTTAMLGSILEAACGGDTGDCSPTEPSVCTADPTVTSVRTADPTAGGGDPGARAWVGGNIGRSLLSDLPAIRPEDIVVLELSSFQLDDLKRLKWSPRLALITNIQPNHLDRHRTLEAYADAKMNIVRFQSAGDAVFVHERDQELVRRVAAVGGAEPRVRYALDPAFSGAVRVPGEHNRDNAAGATALARGLRISGEKILEGLSRFTGLPHRLELVGEVGGVRYFNDSKSTTPESTRLAIDAFREPVVVLVGGRDKGAPFDELSGYLARRAKAVVPYGETRSVFEAQIQESARMLGRALPVRAVESFEQAVRSARSLAEAGDVVVLSPACASYDQFNHYEERGDTFRRLVNEMEPC